MAEEWFALSSGSAPELRVRYGRVSVGGMEAMLLTFLAGRLQHWFRPEAERQGWGWGFLDSVRVELRGKELGTLHGLGEHDDEAMLLPDRSALRLWLERGTWGRWRLKLASEALGTLERRPAPARVERLP
jgi:hypothetical protein